jgi:hypothetical protein
MRALLIVTAALEAATGVTLAVTPSVVTSLLLGAPLDTPAAQTVGRIAGAALVSLGVACWMARADGTGRAAGLAVALLVYNLAAAAVIAMHGLGPGSSGIGLWPACALHGALAAWCTLCLRRGSWHRIPESTRL